MNKSPGFRLNPAARSRYRLIVAVCRTDRVRLPAPLKQQGLCVLLSYTLVGPGFNYGVGCSLVSCVREACWPSSVSCIGWTALIHHLSHPSLLVFLVPTNTAMLLMVG